MASVEKSDLKQSIVLWEFDSYADNGYPQVSSPVQLCARVEAQVSEFDAPADNPHFYKDKIIVNREIALNSIIRVGTLAQAAAANNDQLLIVKAIKKVPDLKNRHCRIYLTTNRYGDTLPTIV